MKILVIYDWTVYPFRSTLLSHLFAFQRYTEASCTYINVGVRRVPRYVSRTTFDLIVVDKSFLEARSDPARFASLVERVQSLADSSACKIAFPQDEFMQTDVLCRFISEFGIDHLFSVAAESEWATLYGNITAPNLHFHRVLTGYLDDDVLATITRLASPKGPRSIDIGYRALPSMCLGDVGYQKQRIGAVVEETARQRHLSVDISTARHDTFYGIAWYRFMLRCKYVLGVEGGSSVLDADGTIRTRTNTYLREHPDSSYEEVKTACYPQSDWTINVTALSPRHLEACATRTCQVLLEGEYNGVLRPDVHYIELKKDFTNLDQVMDLVCDDTRREAITKRAYDDIVASGLYSYRAFIGDVLRKVGRDLSGPARAREPALWVALALWARVADGLCWARIAAAGIVYHLAQRVLLMMVSRDRLRRWRWVVIGILGRQIV